MLFERDKERERTGELGISGLCGTTVIRSASSISRLTSLDVLANGDVEGTDFG
jgi:hypothetical protein